MRPQAKAIVEAVRDNLFQFNVPFMTKADLIELMNSEDPDLQYVRNWSKFTPANLGNLVQRGLFAPEQQPSGLRNLLYSGRDIFRLILLSQAAGYGFPLSTAVQIADEGVRCWDECPVNVGPDGERVDLEKVAERYLAVLRPALHSEAGDSQVLNAAEVVSPLTESQVGAALAGASSMYVVDWTSGLSSAISLARDRWRLKAQDLIAKHKRQSSSRRKRRHESEGAKSRLDGPDK